MSAYGDKLRQEKRVELSQRVFATLVEEIWEMSWTVEDSEEFVDYLMTITNQEAIEEFFNQCHDANGRFCGGSSGGTGKIKGRFSWDKGEAEVKRIAARDAEIQKRYEQDHRSDLHWDDRPPQETKNQGIIPGSVRPQREWDPLKNYYKEK